MNNKVYVLYFQHRHGCISRLLTTACLKTESDTAVCGLAYLPKKHSYIRKDNNPHIKYNYQSIAS